MTTVSLHAYRYCLCPLFWFPFVAPASAQQTDAGLAACARLADGARRLACYDQLAGAAPARPLAPAPAGAQQSGGASTQAVAAAPDPGPATSAQTATRLSLADQCELDPCHERGVCNFRPPLPTYLMATRTAHPNNVPYRPYRDIPKPGADLAHSDLVFQLSFKTKLMQDIAGKPVDLWFGYTQNSFWQASNEKVSPFRETNYQPEFMLVTPLNFSLLGMSARVLNLGIVHQSNGQSSTLSRSWNRVAVQLGLEREGWTVLGRVWKRINEPAATDDNPDIVNHLGRGDLAVTYRRGGSDYSALLRRNLSTGHGAVQLSWAWRLAGHFKGNTQLFSGYGQSLIDYNYYQNVVGLGVLGAF